MSEHTRRVGRNQAVFRRVNERLEDLNEAFRVVTDRFEIVCECGDSGCVDPISLSSKDYEALRADASSFAMIPGHENSAVEQVVEQRSGYNRVKKRTGEPQEIADATDPRS